MFGYVKLCYYVILYFNFFFVKRVNRKLELEWIEDFDEVFGKMKDFGDSVGWGWLVVLRLVCCLEGK